MKLCFGIFIMTFFIYSTVIFSQTEFYPANTIDIRLYGGNSSASSFYDLEGKIEYEIEDPRIADSKKTITFNYEEFTIGAKAEYALTDNLVIFADIPFKYYTLMEKKDSLYVFQINGTDDTESVTQKIILNDLSLFQPEYFEFAVRYRLHSDKTYSALSIAGRIPPGFHNGLQDDTDYNFLSDGAFEVSTGLILGAKFKKGWLESRFNYRSRAEEFKDLLVIHAQGGLTTVPDTKMMCYFEYTQSFGAYKDAVPLDPKKTTLQEDYLNLGLLFQMFLTDNVYGEFSYSLTLLGKNTFSKGGYLFSIGVRL